MDKIFMSMTEFMKTQAPFLGIPTWDIEKAGKQEMTEGKDFYYQVRNVFYTIPLLSLQEYFGVSPVPVPVAPPTNPVPMTVPLPPETKKVTKPTEKF